MTRILEGVKQQKGWNIMSTQLRITSTIQITPLLDIQHEDVAKAYRQGVSDSLRHHDEPVSVLSLLTCLKCAIASGVFDGQHQDDARDFVGFHLGRMHGAILTAHGTRRPNVHTLATLDSKDARRGYDVGREWFFVDSEPDERHFTDAALVKRFTDLVQEEAELPGSSDEVWLYTLACIIGELSGLVFPVSEQERARWERQNQRVLAEMAQKEAQHRQHDTEPLPVPPASQEA